MLAFIIAGHPPDNLLCLPGCFARQLKWGIVRKPDIDVRPLLDVLGKELGFQPGRYQTGGEQKHQRAQQDGPAESDRQS